LALVENGDGMAALDFAPCGIPPKRSTSKNFPPMLGMTTYIAPVKKIIAIQSPAPQPLSLRDRFPNWYRELPTFTRNRPFAMSEFEAAVDQRGGDHPTCRGKFGEAFSIRMNSDRRSSVSPAE
jgi:hypothetical protein